MVDLSHLNMKLVVRELIKKAQQTKTTPFLGPSRSNWSVGKISYAGENISWYPLDKTHICYEISHKTLTRPPHNFFFLLDYKATCTPHQNTPKKTKKNLQYFLQRVELTNFYLFSYELTINIILLLTTTTKYVKFFVSRLYPKERVIHTKNWQHF